MNLSIIVPTLGRHTLARTLASMPLRPGDEWIVVADGEQPHARTTCEAMSQVRYFETPVTHHYGHAQRAFGMRQARGTHIAFMDDDDVYVPGAREQMETVACDRPVIGQVTDRNGAVIWRTPELKLGNISTQMGLFPNVPEKLGVWGAKTAPGVRGGDLDFFTTLKFDEVVWWPCVIALLRPTGPWNNREFYYDV